VQVIGGDVLVVEGEDRRAVGEGLQIGQAPVVPDPDVGGHQRRGVVRGAGQHAE
jgi:hypothetical protein